MSREISPDGTDDLLNLLNDIGDESPSKKFDLLSKHAVVDTIESKLDQASRNLLPSREGSNQNADLENQNQKNDSSDQGMYENLRRTEKTTEAEINNVGRWVEQQFDSRDGSPNSRAVMHTKRLLPEPENMAMGLGDYRVGDVDMIQRDHPLVTASTETVPNDRRPSANFERSWSRVMDDDRFKPSAEVVEKPLHPMPQTDLDPQVEFATKMFEAQVYKDLSGIGEAPERNYEYVKSPRTQKLEKWKAAREKSAAAELAGETSAHLSKIAVTESKPKRTQTLREEIDDLKSRMKCLLHELPRDPTYHRIPALIRNRHTGRNNFIDSPRLGLRHDLYADDNEGAKKKFDYLPSNRYMVSKAERGVARMHQKIGLEGDGIEYLPSSEVVHRVSRAHSGSASPRQMMISYSRDPSPARPVSPVYTTYSYAPSMSARSNHPARPSPSTFVTPSSYLVAGGSLQPYHGNTMGGAHLPHDYVVRSPQQPLGGSGPTSARLLPPF